MHTAPEVLFCQRLTRVVPEKGHKTVVVVIQHLRGSWRWLRYTNLLTYLFWRRIFGDKWHWLFMGVCPSCSVLWHCWLGGRKGIPPVKNRVVRCWCVVCLERGKCKWFAYGPPDATATPSSLAVQNGLPFWCWITQVALEEKPLNGCSSSSSSCPSCQPIMSKHARKQNTDPGQ